MFCRETDALLGQLRKKLQASCASIVNALHLHVIVTVVLSLLAFLLPTLVKQIDVASCLSQHPVDVTSFASLSHRLLTEEDASVSHEIIQLQDEKYQQYLRIKAQFKRNQGLLHSAVSYEQRSDEDSRQNTVEEIEEALQLNKPGDSRNISSVEESHFVYFSSEGSSSSDSDSSSTPIINEERINYTSSLIPFAEPMPTVYSNSSSNHSSVQAKKHRRKRSSIDSKHDKINQDILRTSLHKYFLLEGKVQIHEEMENSCAKRCPCMKYKRRTVKAPLVKSMRLPTIFENVAY